MSILNPGTRCVIVAGCPANIGLVVEVVRRIGPFADYEDAYRVKTVSGRPFRQLWSGNDLQRGSSSEAITDRRKLRPLVDPKDWVDAREIETAD
ncbi:MAG: hypothetical protein ACKVOX_05715 [Rhizobacter sp.]